MRGEASTALSLKEMVADSVLLRDRPVRLDVVGIDVLIWIGTSRIVSADPFEIETIHIAGRLWIRVLAVASIVICRRGMIDIETSREGLFRVRYLRLNVRAANCLEIVAGCSANDARKRYEEIIDAAVFLHDQHDVLDVFATGVRQERWRATPRSKPSAFSNGTCAYHQYGEKGCKRPGFFHKCELLLGPSLTSSINVPSRDPLHRRFP